MNPNHEHPDRDLDWLAFRYIAGELDSAEEAEWDLLLAENQAAREAVARAVELTSATYAAVASESRCEVARNDAGSSRSYIGQWSAWLVAAAAIAVLAAALPWVLPQRNDIALPTPVASDPALAIAWRESVVELPLPQLPAEVPLTSEFAAAEVETNDAWATESPSWLLAAVAAGNEQMMPDDAGEAPRDSEGRPLERDDAPREPSSPTES